MIHLRTRKAHLRDLCLRELGSFSIERVLEYLISFSFRDPCSNTCSSVLTCGAEVPRSAQLGAYFFTVLVMSPDHGMWWYTRFVARGAHRAWLKLTFTLVVSCALFASRRHPGQLVAYWRESHSSDLKAGSVTALAPIDFIHENLHHRVVLPRYLSPLGQSPVDRDLPQASNGDTRSDRLLSSVAWLTRSLNLRK